MHEPFSPGHNSRRRVAGQTMDRRNSERSILSAVAEVTEQISKAKLSVRIGDLSLHGCYADSINVFPRGTRVQVSIRHAGSRLLANAKVVYSKPSMGMGLSFEDLSVESGAILQSWIAGVTGETAPAMETESPKQAVEQARHPEQQTLFILINMMMRKGLITSFEGSELLQELQKH
jgi:hypothetical protein